jgi:hypothetical protein
LGLAFLVVLPRIPGFYVVSLSLGLVFLLIYAPSNLGALLSDLPRGGLRGLALRALLGLALFLAVLAAGSVTALPSLNVAAPAQAGLSPATLAFLERIEGKVLLRAFAQDEASLARARYLLGLYSKAQPLIRTEASLAFGRAEPDPDDLRVARQDSVQVIYRGHGETVSPVTQNSINASLERLLSPPRLVLNLLGEGERSASDPSRRGLSLWQDYLGTKKIYVEDSLWEPGEPAPKASAVILAGPRMPLPPEKEESLREFLLGGGRALLLLDPLVAAVDPSFFAGFGLSLPEGLAVDPASALAGTESSFVVVRDLPLHEITSGLSQPVLLPLSGAIGEAPAEAANGGPAGGAGPQARTLTLVGDDAEGGAVDGGKGGAEGAVDGGEDGAEGAGDGGQGGAEGAGDGGKGGAEGGAAPPAQADAQAAPARGGPLKGETFALAMSAEGSFLETDLNSIRERDFRADESDPQGPLALATATAFEGGGRLVLIADSDLASNAYIGFAGNADFLTNAMYWLLTGEGEPAAPQTGLVLTVNDFLARLFFFVPVIIWPLVVLSVWALFYHRRKKASA